MVSLHVQSASVDSLLIRFNEWDTHPIHVSTCITGTEILIHETAKGPEKGGCLYTDGTVQEWDKGTQPTVSHRKDGSVAVSHGITPFVVNGEKARLGTPVVSWHIHTQIDVPIGNGEKAYLGSSNPSSKDYEYEQTENTGSTFVVG